MLAYDPDQCWLERHRSLDEATIQISCILADLDKEEGSAKLDLVSFLGRLNIWIGRAQRCGVSSRYPDAPPREDGDRDLPRPDGYSEPIHYATTKAVTWALLCPTYRAAMSQCRIWELV